MVKHRAKSQPSQQNMFVFDDRKYYDSRAIYTLRCPGESTNKAAASANCCISNHPVPLCRAVVMSPDPAIPVDVA